MNTIKFLFIAALTATTLGACTDEAERPDKPSANSPANSKQTEPGTPEVNLASGDVFLQLFEWRWQDVAAECENFLGPKGYAAVQVSPAQEHITGTQWWTRYQPVSYKIESRGGTRAEFADMVKRCKSAGVAVYADTITNHMAGIGSGTGVAGSVYGEYSYPVPYTYDDFHHCGRHGDDVIVDYQDLWEVQTCNLSILADLDTGKPAVQAKIAAYLNDLLSLGVSGFRLDAVKHIEHPEVSEYLALMDSKPYIFQEVIDRGGEPINAMDYLDNGDVTEFKYPEALFAAFEHRQLSTLSELGKGAGYLPADKAIVFVDNHDLQRGHAGGDKVLNYKNGALYDLANIFMLGWPYGYPKVMSSYYFEDTDAGPPASRPVAGGVCTSDWVCEHRRASRTGMVGFRKATQGMPVANWHAHSDEVISFGRGDKGFIIINISTETIDGTFVTGMKGGEYCNVVAIGGSKDDCEGSEVRVDENGVMQTTVAPMGAVVIYSPVTVTPIQ